MNVECIDIIEKVVTKTVNYNADKMMIGYREFNENPSEEAFQNWFKTYFESSAFYVENTDFYVFWKRAYYYDKNFLQSNFVKYFKAKKAWRIYVLQGIGEIIVNLIKIDAPEDVIVKVLENKGNI